MDMTHIALAVLPLALFAATFAVWLREKGVRPIAALLRGATAVRRSRGLPAAVLLLFSVGLVHYGATKGTGGSGEPEAGQNDPPRSAPGEPAAITNLVFTGIATSSNAVSLSLAWPTNLLSGGETLDLFAKAHSFTNAWRWLRGISVPPEATNLTVSVSAAELSAAGMPFEAFFRVSDRASLSSSMSDQDGDGIPDAYELVHGTNPYVPDAALVPRTTVGPSGDYATLPEAFAASASHSVVALSAGEHVLSGSVVMPDHPVIVTGPDDGFAVLRSTADTAVVKFEDGQDAQTLFRNLVVVLEAESGFQSGFWVGGNLPWAGIGASPMFENVRVRAPYPGVLYYGWHYYRDDGGTSSLSNCAMNAAGATSVIGVYVNGGQDVFLSECSFVNFPATNGNYAVFVTNSTHDVAEYAQPRPDLSWAGCPLSGGYSTSSDSDGDGLSDYAEVFTHDTDPYLADSDCDGASDSLETSDGTDPKDCSDFLRRMTVVAATSDMAADVTNYVAWGVSPSGWETNGLVACASLPATNTLTAFSSSAAYAKSYADLNRNGEYDEGADILLVRPLPPHGAFSTTTFIFGDVDRDGVPDSQERADGTDPYDAMSFRLTATIVVTDSDPGATNCLAWGTGTVTNGSVAFSGESATVLVDAVTTNGTAFARCVRRFASGAEVPYSLTLSKSDNGGTVAMRIGDADGDAIPDSVELSHGTGPTDERSYCFGMSFLVTGVPSTTNYLTAVALFGTNTVSGPVAVTNGKWSADLGHLVAGNGEKVALYFWDDANSNGVRDAWECCVTQRLAVAGHDNAVTNALALGVFDMDSDGMLDCWETSHGLSPTNSADAWLDPDGDGLINLHEYWADCDPLTQDGSNTVLSVMARSATENLTHDATGRMAKFLAGSYGSLLNTNCWAYLVDTSSASPMNSMNGGGQRRAGTAITKRHIVMAAHYPLDIGTTVFFLGIDGIGCSRTVVATNQVLTSDISVCILDADLPDAVHPAKLLPMDYRLYIGDGRGLPGLMFDHSERAILSEFDALPERRGNVNGRVPTDSLRHAYFDAVVPGDSGNPKFLLMNNEAILVCTLLSHGTGGSGAGPFLSSWADELQAAMDELSDELGVERLSLQYYHFSGYDRIRE